ncbi:MAG: prepilin-type N-terminal cleavage/methylation domain-containing protein [Firmicutes bacterium]|nr:prepilin-type N-terminal cleavage/methylation domain-containing protein [Bacillota bacterium]
MFKFIRSRAGLTLVEVLTAVFILGIVVAPLTGFFVISNNRARQTMTQRQALAIAEDYLERLRAETHEASFIYPGEEIPVETEGRFTVYTEVTELENAPGGDPENPRPLFEVKVRVEWNGGEVSLSTIRSELRR